MRYLDLAKNEDISKEFKIEILNNESYPLKTFPIQSDINIIVGANNSRKSRFFRYIFQMSPLIIGNSSIAGTIERFENLIRSLLDLTTGLDHLKIENLKPTEGIAPYRNGADFFKPVIDFINLNLPNPFTVDVNYFSDIKNTLSLNFSSPKKENNQSISASIEEAIAIINFLLSFNDIHANSEIRDFFKITYTQNMPRPKQIERELNELKTILQDYINLEIEILNPSITYIPTLRGSVSLISSNTGKVNSKVYEDTIKDNFTFLKNNENLKIFTGLDLYDRVKLARNSKRDIRLKFEAFENFLEEFFFGGNEIDIVALEGTKDIIQIYIKGDSDRAIYDIGDGIQAIINLIYPIFIAEDNEWIFIEEPELNMHPGLQTLFLNTLIENEFIKEKNLKIFITTHSNHLLDVLLTKPDKCSIFSFEKQSFEGDNFTLIRQLLGPNNHILDLLGVTNSSVFMSNCSIWVEGVSDRRYLSAFIKAYYNDSINEDFFKYSEDIHYSYFEYAGTNLSHYLFDIRSNQTSKDIKAHFLSNRIFLLADKDENKEKKHSELKKLNAQGSSFFYQHTEAIEIENLLSPSILKLLFTQKFKLKKDISFSSDDYKDIRMGAFFNKKINPLLSKERNISESNGTLKQYYKTIFSEFVYEGVMNKEITWDMIKENPYARQLTKNLVRFIDRQNKNET